MTIKEMNERRKELGYSYERLADLSGVPVGTVQKVLGGITKSPRYDTLLALERVLKPYENCVVKQNAVIYGEKRPGEYTIDDYYALPDEERVELIDGVFYNMSSPTSIHQIFASRICTKLENFVMSKKGSCIPIGAAVDVQLDCDNKTIVQPDVIVICDRDKFRKGIIYGAPEFVVEVLSPSTSKKDRTLKLSKYIEAGVREYWIVDPKKKCVIVYINNDDEEYDISVYTFENEVPVYIFENECKIDFKEIYEQIEFLYEK